MDKLFLFIIPIYSTLKCKQGKKKGLHRKKIEKENWRDLYSMLFVFIKKNKVVRVKAEKNAE